GSLPGRCRIPPYILKGFITMSANQLVHNPDVYVMAQFLDESGLEGLFDNAGNVIQTLGTIAIAVVVAFFAIPPLLKGMKEIAGKNMNAGLMELLKGVFVMIIDAESIGGLFGIVDAINPVESQSGIIEYLET